MHDIFGVFGPVLDFPRVLPQIVLVPQFVGEKTADFPRLLSLQSCPCVTMSNLMSIYLIYCYQFVGLTCENICNGTIITWHWSVGAKKTNE